MNLRVCSFGIAILLGSTFISACGNSSVHTLTPTQEAYQLMDKGDNAKAALILENEVATNPDNKKAKQLLGTAYIGLAGVDVYSIQSAFEDVLFRQSLREQVFSPSSSKNSDSVQTEVETTLKGGEKVLQELDSTFTTLQKIVVYLVRFPQVPKDKWPYLEKALTELEADNDTVDVPVYRILVRMIYMKSYLVENVVKDDNFGTRKWACTFDFGDLNEGLTFMHTQMEGAKSDLDMAIKLGAKKLAKASDMVNALTSDAGMGDSITALQESMTVQQGESRLRSLLGCEKI